MVEGSSQSAVWLFLDFSAVCVLILVHGVLSDIEALCLLSLCICRQASVSLSRGLFCMVNVDVPALISFKIIVSI